MFSTLHGIWTALLLIVFIAIVIWAFSKRRRDSFERAAHSVLQDENAPEETNGGRTHG